MPHVSSGDNEQCGVAKSVRIKSVEAKKTTKITLRKGRSSKIKAVEAEGKGTCKIWIYAQNGVYKTITVTVK